MKKTGLIISVCVALISLAALVTFIGCDGGSFSCQEDETCYVFQEAPTNSCSDISSGFIQIGGCSRTNLLGVCKNIREKSYLYDWYIYKDEKLDADEAKNSCEKNGGQWSQALH